MKSWLIYSLKYLFLFFIVYSSTPCIASSSPLVKSDFSELNGFSSGEANLIDIRFSSPNSPTAYEEAYIVKGRKNTYYVSLPDTTDTKNLNIEIISSKDSQIQIGDVALDSEDGVYNGVDVSISRGVFNIENTLTLDVKGAFGNHNRYDLLVKRGNKELDSLVYQFKEKYNIPGISFAIASLENTNTVYKSGYGYAIRESKVRVRPNHLFRLASMSKQHTAIAILKLVEDGKIGLNDTVFGPSGILKDQFDNVPLRARNITVKHLLEHTSGYRTHPDYMFDRPYYGWSMRQRIQAMLRSSQPNEPGTVFAYYNTGYGILGYIVEAVSGKTFEEYLKEIYASVGVDDIHVGGTQSERKWNEVAYYSQNNSSAEGLDMNVRAAAGGLIASTEQLIKLLFALDGNPNIPDLITCETRDLMFTPSETGRSRYSLGWRTNHEYFPYSYYHGGTLTGVSTFWVYSHGYAVIFLCNSRNGSRKFDNDLYQMARDVISLVEEKGL